MNYFKVAAAALVTTFLTAAFSQPSSGDSLMNPENPYGFDGIGINIADAWVNNGDQASLLRGVKTSNGKIKNFICNDIDDCNLAALDSVAGNVLLEGCANASDRDCVESASLTLGEIELTGSYLGQSAGEKVIGDPRVKLPGGGGVSLWKFAIPTSTSEILIGIHADLNVAYSKAAKKFVQNELAVIAMPYTLKSGNYQPPSSKVSVDGNGNEFIGTSGFPSECAWVTPKQCGVFAEFPPGASFSISMRLSKDLGGWLMGRVLNPEVAISSLDSQYSRVEVSGAVAAVPKVFVVAPKSEAKAEMDKAFPNAPAKLNVVNVRANDSWTANLLEIFRNLAKDKSIGDYTVWSFSSQATKDPCFKSNSGFQGFVSTNASVYQGTPPAMKDGSLRYKVSGYHYTADGITPNLGRYSLIMKSSAAKCMYGFSNAPIQASISVTGGGGDQLVKTEVLGEKNGWLRFAASGFTFSSKQVVVTLSQAGMTTLTAFSQNKTSLSSQQQGEIGSIINRSNDLSKFICTGIYFEAKDAIPARARAKAACDYARSLNPEFSYWYQTKQTKSAKYSNKVLVVTK